MSSSSTVVDAKPKTNMADGDSTADAEEKRGWKETAAANRVVLKNVDLKDSTDMKELYEMLGVTGVGPKTRLRSYIESLQEKQQDGKLRCCCVFSCSLC